MLQAAKLEAQGLGCHQEPHMLDMEVQDLVFVWLGFSLVSVGSFLAMPQFSVILEVFDLSFYLIGVHA